MRGRDLQVSVVALFAAYLTLQYTPDVDVQLRWILSGSLESKQPKVPVPLPLVTDLDGDGHNEILLLTKGGTNITSISVPYASGETWVKPIIKYQEVRGSPAAQRPAAQRPVVAIAVDNLDLWQGKSASDKHVVVVRDNWIAEGYNGALHREWEYLLKNDASLKDGGSYVVDQAAITFAPLFSPDGARSRPGLIIGGSMRHRNRGRETVGQTLEDATGAEARGAAHVSDVHMESFTHKDKRDGIEEVPASEQLRDRTAAKHFSLFALTSKGVEVWRHESTAGDGKSTGASERSDLWPNFELSQLKDVGTNADAMLLRGLREAKGGSRGIRRALLSLLPHLWSDPVDTRLEIHQLPSRGSRLYATSPTEGKALESSSPGGGSRTRAGGKDSNSPEPLGKQGAAIWAVVAHTREGMEALDLRDGTALGVVALPATAGGAGVYADVNGDGLVDHVQAVGTKGAHGWAHVLLEEAKRPSGPPNATSQADKLRGFPPCYAVAVSGLPPREQLFNGSLCHDGGALLSMKMNRAKSRPSRESEVMAATPAVVSRVAAPGVRKAAKGGSTTSDTSEDARKGQTRGRRWDVVFAVSSGVVTSYDSEGRLNWQSKLGPTWEGGEGNGKGGGYVVPFHLEAADGNARSDASGYTTGQYLLVAGQAKMCIFDPMGNVVGSTPLAFPPKNRPVAGDFDADGFTDFVVVGGDGSVAGYALAPDPGIRALFMLVVAMVVTMLVVAAVYVPAPGRSRARGAAPKRSTD